MIGPLRTTYEAMPDPKVVLAAGTDAISGGLVCPSYATRDGIGSIRAGRRLRPRVAPEPVQPAARDPVAMGLLPRRGRPMTGRSCSPPLSSGRSAPLVDLVAGPGRDRARVASRTSRSCSAAGLSPLLA